MKNIKDITISIFAIIGFVTILSSFNNQSEPQVTNGTPESHVWDALFSPGADARMYLYNKKTGEMRKYSRTYPSEKGTKARDVGRDYIIMRQQSNPSTN